MPFQKGHIPINKLDPLEKKRRHAECFRKWHQRYKETHPEAHSARHRRESLFYAAQQKQKDPEKWRRRHRECGAKSRRTHKRTPFAGALRRQYGLSVAMYDLMVLSQEGRCLICNRTTQLHVDHDHVNSRIRGLLCGPCNTGLGMFGDDPRLLMVAAQYLKGGLGETR